MNPLGKSVLTPLAVLCLATTAAFAQPAARVWTTSLDLQQHLTEQKPLVFAPDSGESGPRPATTIVVNPEERFQTMLGLGSSLEASTCANLRAMSPAGRADVVERLVNPRTGAGMNLMRVCIGSSDFTGDPWYSYDDLPPGGTDPELRRFSIGRDANYILPVLKLARAKNRELLFFASPWSPPGWMKTTGTMIGGELLPRYYPAYARYFVKFIRAYEAAGIPIHAVTVQNEPGVDRAKEKDPKWHYPSCHWTPEQERDFIRDHLGPALQRERLKTEIWCYDHNYNLQPSADSAGLSHPRTVLADARAAKFVAGVGFHGYEGDASAMGQFHREFPSTPVYFTEGSVFGIEGTVDLIERLRNQASSYNAWVTMLDDHGKPNNGPFPATHAMVALDSRSKQATYLFEYYSAGQFMKFIQRGAIRIGSTAGDKDLDNVAFRNPDRTIVLILANTTAAAREVAVRCGKLHVKLELGAKSVATLSWPAR